MSWYLGFDTSNYTSSVAVFDSETGEIVQQKKLLPVAGGQLGLRQSDAVFHHVKQLGDLLENVLEDLPGRPRAVAASVSPRDEEGSYMPCFLVGGLAARASAATAKVPCYAFSHQAGHVMAALYSARQLSLAKGRFLAFHFSGGTTQCLLVEPDAEHIFRITTIAETLDLNAGQVVDRVGGMLGLSFPAGPALEKLALLSARSFQIKPTFKGCNCCLSGVENQCRNMQAEGEVPADIARYCLDYLAAAVLRMTACCLEQHPGLPLVYVGGVLSNSLIRKAVESRYTACFAEPRLSCDNAVGIAVLCAVRNGGAKLC